MWRSIALSVPKKQEEWYSGKKKQHTIKSQIIADMISHTIYDADEAPGSVHDLLFLCVIILADSGYQGIVSYFYCMEFL